MRRLLSSVFALALLAACAAPGIAPVDLLGAAAPSSAAIRTIVITPDTRWVNVTGGDTVRFIAGDQSFAWNFTVARTVTTFALNRVAPPGILTHTVVAYVARDPQDIGEGAGSNGSR